MFQRETNSRHFSSKRQAIIVGFMLILTLSISVRALFSLTLQFKNLTLIAALKMSSVELTNAMYYIKHNGKLKPRENIYLHFLSALQGPDSLFIVYFITKSNDVRLAKTRLT